MNKINKYHDNVLEGYLDDDQKYWDYGTATYNGDGNIIDTKHTGISFYDQFFDSKEKDYLNNVKNLKGEVVMMTPDEYYDICAHRIFNTTVSKLKKERGEYDRRIINNLFNVVNKYKRKLCMPMINYADNGQEGLHRMLAIGELLGWDHKVPVLVVDWFDKERHEREEKEAKQHRIDTKIERAITETLHYQFTDLEDLTIQLQLELVRQFKYDDDIYVPEQIDIKENNDSIILTFMKKEYPIDRDDINWREEDEDDTSLDDIDVEETEDFFKRYFGDDWKTTHSHLNESSEALDKETIINVLEEHNHCYYQDSTMALECICEKLFYDYNIDARYRGRSIYIGEKKIATIKIERENWNTVGMYGYTLFI